MLQLFSLNYLAAHTVSWGSMLWSFEYNMFVHPKYLGLKLATLHFYNNIKISLKHIIIKYIQLLS